MNYNVNKGCEYMNKISNILWGLILIVVGVIFGLNALEITDINIFFDGWWTLILIIPCFIGLLKDKDKTGDLVGLFIGLGLLLACQDIINFKIVYKLILPTILVIVGLSVIFKGTIESKIKEEIKKLNKNNDKEYAATFGEQNLDFSNEKFSGCDLNAVFGGVKCNVVTSKITEDVVINATAVFGGITIYVPDDINVKVTSTSIFGGVSDERKNKKTDSKVTIYINATCMFGGIEIK